MSYGQKIRSYNFFEGHGCASLAKFPSRVPGDACLLNKCLKVAKYLQGVLQCTIFFT